MAIFIFCTSAAFHTYVPQNTPWPHWRSEPLYVFRRAWPWMAQCIQLWRLYTRVTSVYHIWHTCIRLTVVCANLPSSRGFHGVIVIVVAPWVQMFLCDCNYGRTLNNIHFHCVIVIVVAHWIHMFLCDCNYGRTLNKHIHFHCVVVIVVAPWVHIFSGCDRNCGILDSKVFKVWS